jgi:aspartate aminotransferase
MISNRASKIEASPTLAIDAKAKSMRQHGIHVINFSVGEPDFPTPENVKEAAIKAINEDFTYYTPTSGIPELREALAKKLKSFNGLDYIPDQISISCGGKHSLFNIMQVILNPEDEVLLPVPYWVSYIEQIKLAGGKPILVPTDSQYKINAELLEERITDRSRLLILNSPSNPAGTICEEDELRKISEIILKKDLWVISDEVYESFIYDGKKHVSIASLNQDIYNKTIISNSFSKTYSMTGWRVGYTAGPIKIIKAINSFQSHVTSNPNSIAQKAALEALLGSQNSVRKMIDSFDKRRKYILKRFNEIPELDCNKPEGAFYVFPKISGVKMKSMDFAKKILEESHVALVPGKAFGIDENLRLSYAISIEDIEEGLNRIYKFCNRNKLH